MFWRRNRKAIEGQIEAAPRKVVPLVERYRRGEVNQALLKLDEFMLTLPHQPQANSPKKERTAAQNREISLKTYPRNTTHALFNTLRKKLDAVDYSYVNSERGKLFNLTYILNDEIPRALNEADTALSLGQWSEERTIFFDIIAQLEEAITLVTEDFPSTLSQLNPIYEEEESAVQVSGFPSISVYEGMDGLYQELESLHADWMQAQTMKLSTEGEFIIEQVAASYLPEAFKLHTRLMGRQDEDVQKKAHEMLAEQVTLIHKQVQFVLSQHVDDSFSSIEAHMSFLKEKNIRLGIE